MYGHGVRDREAGLVDVEARPHDVAAAGLEVRDQRVERGVLDLQRQAQLGGQRARAVHVEADGLGRVGHVSRGEELHRRVLDVHAVDQGARGEQRGRGGDRRRRRGGGDGLWASAAPAVVSSRAAPSSKPPAVRVRDVMNAGSSRVRPSGAGAIPRDTPARTTPPVGSASLSTRLYHAGTGRRKTLRRRGPVSDGRQSEAGVSGSGSRSSMADLIRPAARTFFNAPVCDDLDGLDAEVGFLGVPWDQGVIIPSIRSGASAGPRLVRDTRTRLKDTLPGRLVRGLVRHRDRAAPPAGRAPGRLR